MERNYGIDLIKVCSCMGVCALHFYYDTIQTSAFRMDFMLFYMAAMAIPLFFMVNGYLLFSKERTSKYYVKRIMNIVKIVLSVNVLYFIIPILQGEAHWWKPIKQTIYNLFLQRGFFGEFWFLGALILIYIIMAKLPSKYLTTKIILIAVVALSIISLVMNGINLFTFTPGNMFEAHIPQPFRLYNHVTYFLIGGLIAKNKESLDEYMERNSLRNKVVCVLSVFICVISVTIKCNTIYEPLCVEYCHCSIISTIGCASLFYLMLNIKYHEVSQKVISLLGTAVMIVYLTHDTVLYHTNISCGGLIYNYILLLLLLLFTNGILLDKIKFVHNFVKI